MKNKIEKFLKNYGLLKQDNIIAVGFSGGYDSMCLLDILKELSKKYNFKIIAGHLNHNWRGEESKYEQKRCEEFCKKNNITFYTQTLDENEKHTETHARELRYNFFKEIINKFNANALLTAHTKSDTSETLIYRITKGTGIKGLQGIAPKLNNIYRPMLDISREEIEKYCKDNNLIPNNDSSNQDNKYARNLIRNEILPILKSVNPKVEEAINSLSILAFEEEQLVKEYINTFSDKLYTDNKINTQVFKGLSNLLKKRIIYELYVKYDIEYSQEKVENTLKFIEENINSKSGSKTSIDSTKWLFVNSKTIELITKTEKFSETLKINKEGTYDFLGYEFTIEKCIEKPKTFPLDKEFKAYVNIENIDFELRTRRCGDRIQPLGSKSTIKFKDYLINKGIPQHKKDEIILLCNQSEILWVSGLGVNEKIKVVNNSTHVLTLKKKQGVY